MTGATAPTPSAVIVGATAGLPVHAVETATLAVAVSGVIGHELAGDSGRVRTIAAQFTGPVPGPSTQFVRGRGAAAGHIGVDVADPGGRTLARAQVAW